MNRFPLAHAALATALLFGACTSVGAAVDEQPSRNLESGGGAYEPPTDQIDDAAQAKLLKTARDTAARLGLGTDQGQVKQFTQAASKQSARASSRGLPEEAPRLIWPVRPSAANRNDFQTGVSGYIDHDEETGSLLDYACGNRTYDLSNGYNHDGVDISSWPYPWTVMDADGLEVIAAADGTIVGKIGEQFDRNCSTSTQAPWNLIVLAHNDGSQSLYGHMKRDSLTDKGIGDTVVAGEYLGQVGSSGASTGPHLHFQLLDADNNNVDPFAGECGATDSHWRWQPDYNRPRINAVLTSASVPEIGRCDGSEAPGLQTEFAAGAVVVATGFFVNQPAGQAARIEVIQPNGAVWLDQPMGTPSQTFAFSYWYRAFIPPPIAGQWRVRMTLNGERSETGFFIGQPDQAGQLVAAVLPGSRSVGLDQSASIFATIVNGSDVTLKGCRVLPLGPFAGQLNFQTTSAATNEPVGEPNTAVTLPPGSAQSFVLTLDPGTEVVPSNVEFNFKCNNAPRAQVIRGVNTLQFSSAAEAGADIIPITVTADGDGVVRLNGPNGIAAFGTAAINIAQPAAGVSVLPLAQGLDLNLSICETTITGACKTIPAAQLAVDFAEQAKTFSVFVQGTGEPIAFDPANHRVELRFETDGEIHGLVSVAVTTAQ